MAAEETANHFDLPWHQNSGSGSTARIWFCFGDKMSRLNLHIITVSTPQIPSATNALEISDMQEGNWSLG